MMLVLVVALLGGQVIYEWVDAQGQSHFTNDASSIPSGAKRRETKGAEISVMPATTPAPANPDVAPAPANPDVAPAPANPDVAPAPANPDVAAAPPAEVDTCEAAKGEINELERRIDQQLIAGAQMQQDQGYACQLELMTHGQPNFAMCMAGRSEPIAPDQSMAMDLEEAREMLRRAQSNGCR